MRHGTINYKIASRHVERRREKKEGQKEGKLGDTCHSALFYRRQWAVGSPGFSWFFYTPLVLPLWLEFGRLSRTGATLQSLTFRGERGRCSQTEGWERERERESHWQLQGNAFTWMLGHRPQWFNNRLCDLLLPSPLLLSFYVFFSLYCSCS